MQRVWIEAALNGPWGPQQPGIPRDVESIVAQGIACALAGACIIHVHAYDGGEAQVFDWEVYARIIEGIRSEVDVPVYPSVPTTGTGAGPDGGEAAKFAHLPELAKRGLIEFAVIDPGSVNFTLMAPGEAPAGTYQNGEAELREALALAAEHGFHPSYAIYEPGFTRAGAALARITPGLPVPLYRFMFSDHFAWGFPPKERYLETHLDLLDESHPGAPWMVAGLGVDIAPLVELAVRRGGHVRAGLEDAPLGCETSNLGLVEEMVAHVRAAGGEPATVEEMWTELRG